MDFKYSKKIEKKEVVSSLWNYYTFIYAPRIAFFLVNIVFFSYAAWYMQDYAITACAAVYGLVFLIEFPLFCKRILEVIAPTGIFDHVTELHFSDHILTTTCGLNTSSTEYKSFTGYFCKKNTIFLLMGKHLFSSAFSKEIFPDQGEELLRCLENDGVKPVHFLFRKAWLIAAATGIAVLTIMCFLIFK